MLLSRAPASFVIPADIETIPLYVLQPCISLPLSESTFGLMKKASAHRASHMASRNCLIRTVFATSKGISLTARSPFTLAWSKPRFFVYDLVSRHAVPTFFCRRVSRRAVDCSSMGCVRFILFCDQKEGCHFFQACLHSKWLKEVFTSPFLFKPRKVLCPTILGKDRKKFGRLLLTSKIFKVC